MGRKPVNRRTRARARQQKVGLGAPRQRAVVERLGTGPTCENTDLHETVRTCIEVELRERGPRALTVENGWRRIDAGRSVWVREMACGCSIICGRLPYAL